VIDDECDWDGEPVDLDGCDVTGDPQLDVFGYQSPRTRAPRQGFKASPQRDWLAQSRRDRAEREARRDRQQQREEARRRQSPSSHQIVAWPREMDYQPGMGPLRAGRVTPPVAPPTPVPDLAPRAAQAVERDAVGRPAGWYRVDVTLDGRTTWTPVDQPGDGPQMTVQQSPAQQWRPVELTEPRPGTQVW
jgi:hypothetical protein